MAGLLSRFFGPKPPSDIVWLTPDIAHSAAFDARDATAMDRLAIGALLDLRARQRHELEPLGKAGLHYLHLEVADDAAPALDELSRAADWVRQELGDDRKVLVHCARDGRGALAVTAALLMRMGYPLPDALTVARRGRDAPLSDGQMSALQRYAEALGR